MSSIDARQRVESLGEISSELVNLNRDTEFVFLRIGAKVSEFIDTVSLLSSDLTSLAELISGEHGKQASDALTGALDLSEDMRQRSADGNQLLGNMQLEARSLKQTLSHFNGTVATFHSLGLLTRIETARLGSLGADFGNLAEDVRLLARNVQTRVDAALDTAGELVPQIETALQDASALQSDLAQNLPAVISQSLASLSSFSDMQTSARQASVRLAADYGQVSEAFKRVIISMQFNDITRQQVEHVIDVFKRLQVSSGEPDGFLLERPGAAAVLDLQSSLLSNARAQFSASVVEVLQCLDEIANLVLNMARESRTLSHLSGSGKNSFLRQMEEGCSAILKTLSHCTNADAASAATTESLAATTRRVRASIGEIRTIETQMLRIGMNARISANHLGASGEALSALADSIKQRAFESRLGSDLLVKTLDVLAELATTSFQQVRRSADEQCARDERLAEIQAAVDVLRMSQENSATRIARILAQGERLHNDLVTTRANFTVNESFATAVSKAQARLIAIANQLRLNTTGADPQDMLSLAEFAGHYTMNAERDIHSQAAQGMEDNPATLASANLEDDVVFF